MTIAATNPPGVNGRPDKISIKGELLRYRADERTAGMCPKRRIVRATVKAIIESRRKWPRELLAWKARIELHYYHGEGDGPTPPWLDERNLTPPQRERALFADRKHLALMARLRTADGDHARDAAHDALSEFYALDAAL